MVNNSFKPFFIGRFESRSDGVVLAGRFTMQWLVKAFMSVWFGAILLGALVAVPALLAHGQPLAWGLLALPAFLAAGVAIVWLGQWFARNDVAWLSAIIRAALESSRENAGASPVPGRAAPVALRGGAVSPLNITAMILALAGVLSWYSGISGIASVRPGAHGFTIAYHATLAARCIAAFFGTAFLGVAWGVYRRQYLAWRLGFVAIGVVWLQSTLRMLGSVDFHGAQGPLILMDAAALLVALYWGRWWYAQRVHFDGRD
jgi:hypothetical protein